MEEKNLAAALQREIKRVSDDVIPAYVEIGPAGAFAVGWMREAVRQGIKALAEQDAVECLRIYNVLKDAHT